MWISRRPNIRASIENAPGPSNAIAVDKTTISMLKATATETRPIKTATNGVTNPSSREMAARRTRAAIPNADAENSDDLTCVTV